MIKISKRLKMVASMVSPGNRLADVGTDHAYVPIYLLEAGHIPSAIAMDINEGPLKRAMENVARYGYEDRISLRLSDGLDRLEPDEADTILIAGMGGPLMARILADHMATARKAGELILQPQSEIARFRHWLHDNGWRIQEERMVRDEGKYYAAMRAVPGEERYAEEWAYRFGKCLVDARSPVLKEWLLKEQEKYRKIRDHLAQAGQNNEDRQAFIRDHLDDIAGTLSIYEEGGGYI